MTMMIMMIIITFCALDILILEFLTCKWQLAWNMLIKFVYIIIIIIIIIISIITVFAGVLFVHQPGANHTPRIRLFAMFMHGEKRERLLQEPCCSYVFFLLGVL